MRSLPMLTSGSASLVPEVTTNPMQKLRSSPILASMLAILAPIGSVYARLMSIRRFAYKMGWIKSETLGVPVISVGNLVVGGTGKTPLVSAILDILPEALRPCLVLSRGYGHRFELEGARLNDEGHMLRRRHVDARIAQDANRAKLGASLIASQRVGCVILDDGAQHLRIRRDLEFMTFDARDLLSVRRCLPAGTWRESLGAASAATALILTRSDEVPAKELSAAMKVLRSVAPAAPIITARHAFTGLFDLDGQPFPTESLSGRRIVGFAGIARPNSFKSTLLRLGAEFTSFVTFPDHHGYDLASRRAIEASDPFAELLVTTEKDAVKLRQSDFSLPVVVVRMNLEFGDRGRTVLKILTSWISENQDRAGSCCATS